MFIFTYEYKSDLLFIIIYYCVRNRIFWRKENLISFNIRCLVSFIIWFGILLFKNIYTISFCIKQTGKLTYFYTSTYYPVL
jgi:hypothetical protein